MFVAHEGKKESVVKFPSGNRYSVDFGLFAQLIGVPPGYLSVSVKVDDNSDEFDAMMVAGSVGINCTSSGGKIGEGEEDLDTVSAKTGWWIFERKSQAVLDAEKAEKERKG